MGLVEITAQILSIAASVLCFISFQMKDTRKLYIAQCTSAVLFVISFLLLGEITPAILNLINIPRGLALSAGKKWTTPKIYFCIQSMIVCAGVIGVVTYIPADGTTQTMIVLSYAAKIVATLIQLFSTYTMWTGNGKLIRLGQIFIVSPGWLFSDIIFFSIGGILTELINMISILISFARFGLNGFIDASEEPSAPSEQA